MLLLVCLFGRALNKKKRFIWAQACVSSHHPDIEHAKLTIGEHDGQNSWSLLEGKDNKERVNEIRH